VRVRGLDTLYDKLHVCNLEVRDGLLPRRTQRWSARDAAAAFAKLITEGHQLGHKISLIVLRTDNDTIYRLTVVTSSLSVRAKVYGRRRLRHMYTPPMLQWLSASGALLHITRSLLSLLELSHEYWPRAAQHALYLYVRRPHTTLWVFDALGAGVNKLRVQSGRGQPLSFTLSFGEIPWFDEEGEIRRCDWLERNP